MRRRAAHTLARAASESPANRPASIARFVVARRDAAVDGSALIAAATAHTWVGGDSDSENPRLADERKDVNASMLATLNCVASRVLSWGRRSFVYLFSSA
jgi:hypothetical protein